MKKNSLIIWVDVCLFVLLMTTILTVVTEVFTHSFLHVFLGILLSAGALLHIGLHWGWIKNALQRFGHLPDQARANACLDLVLFCAYIACGGMGLIARLFLILLPFHIVLGILHVFLAALVIVLQITHLALHWKWVTATARRIIGARQYQTGP